MYGGETDILDGRFGEIFYYMGGQRNADPFNVKHYLPNRPKLFWPWSRHLDFSTMLLQLVFVLTATLTVKASPQAMFADCPDTHREFCYHGTCRFLVSEWEPSCICFTGYFGSRCQYIDLLQVMAVDPRTFTVVALAVTFVVLLGVMGSTCFGVYVYRIKKKNRMGLLPNMHAPVNLMRYASKKPCPSSIHQADLEEGSATNST